MWEIGSKEHAQRHRSFADRPAAAFTLVELLVVICILVLVATLFPVAFNRLIPARRFMVATDQLALNVSDAHLRSVTTGRIVRISISDSAYTIADGQRASKTVSLPGSVSLRFSTSRSDAKSTELVFYPDGSSSGGQVEISDGKRRTVFEATVLTGHLRRVMSG